LHNQNPGRETDQGFLCTPWIGYAVDQRNRRDDMELSGLKEAPRQSIPFTIRLID
jgi:hypothetical protein